MMNAPDRFGGPLIDLEETDFDPLHPGVFLERRLEKKKITAAEFARECGIDGDEVNAVIKKRRLPDDNFILKAARVFEEASLLFVAEREVFQAYEGRQYSARAQYKRQGQKLG